MNRALSLVRDDEIPNPIETKAQVCTAVARALEGGLIERHDNLMGDGETLIVGQLPGGKRLVIRCPIDALGEGSSWLIREIAAEMRERMRKLSLTPRR